LVVISTGLVAFAAPADDEVEEDKDPADCSEENYSRQRFYPLTLADRRAGLHLGCDYRRRNRLKARLRLAAGREW